MKTGTMGAAAAALAFSIEKFGGAIASLLAAMADGVRAARDYERLNKLGDAELARRDLTRDGLARFVLERNFR